MAIAAACPNCKARFRLADDMAGKRVKCQKCAGVFVVGIAPAPAEEKAAGTSAAPLPSIPLPPPPSDDPPVQAQKRRRREVEDDEPEEEERPPLRKKARTKERSSKRAKAKSGSSMMPIILGVAGVSLFLCFGCSGVGAIWFLAKRDDQPGKRDFAIRDKKGGDFNKQLPPIPVPINKGQPPVPAVAIQVNLGPDGTFRQDGQLTMQDPFCQDGTRHKLYSVRMEANRTYQIDLMSNQFDAFLNIVDQNGAVVASDDDGGGGLNARIVFTCVREGVFHIEATHFGDNETGAYTFIIRRIR